MQYNNVVISLGSNAHDAGGQMQRALRWLKSVMAEPHCSDVYSTPPLSGVGACYLNSVMSGIVDISCDELNCRLKQYEKEAGRTPELKQQNIVPIDLDIVIYGDVVLRPKDFGYDFFQQGYKQIIADRKSPVD